MLGQRKLWYRFLASDSNERNHGRIASANDIIVITGVTHRDYVATAREFLQRRSLEHLPAGFAFALNQETRRRKKSDEEETDSEGNTSVQAFVQYLKMYRVHQPPLDSVEHACVDIRARLKYGKQEPYEVRGPSRQLECLC